MSQSIIDDQDLSQVTYTGTWIKGGSAQEHKETVASSTNVGDYFSVRFSGNSITVYGTIDATSEGVLTNYSIDGAPPAQATSQAGAGDTFNQQFWHSSPLELGDHTLVVTMAKVNSNPVPGEGTIWFDYFVASDPRIREDGLKASKRKIIGGVVGGVVGLILVIGVLFFLYRRRKLRQKPAHVQPIFWPGGESVPKVGRGPVTPFDVTESQTIDPTIDPWVPSSLYQDSETYRYSSSGDTSTRSIIISQRKADMYRQSRGHTPSSFTPSAKVQTRQSFASRSSRPSDRPISAEGAQNRTHENQDLSSISENRPNTSQTTDSVAGDALQHVDSGVRNVEDLAITTTGGTVELPPVYSPV